MNPVVRENRCYFNVRSILLLVRLNHIRRVILGLSLVKMGYIRYTAASHTKNQGRPHTEVMSRNMLQATIRNQGRLHGKDTL